MLSIHSQETIAHCNVYSHSFRFRWEAHFLPCCTSSHVFRTEKSFQHVKLVHLRMHFALAACRSNVISRLHWMFDFRDIFMVDIDVKYFATVHLFIIKINSVHEEIIRWSDVDPFFRCLELSFYIAISSVAKGENIRTVFLHVLQ